MYLQHVLDHDPQLLEAALTLHQQGRIPPNTWVVDLDLVVENAKALAAEAQRLKLTTYLMAKQHNRNPYINALALAHGLHKLVAVDATGALMAQRYGLPLGHVGHLNQIPRRLVPRIIAMRPEVCTIYNLEHARWFSEAAANLDMIQDVLLRVSAEGDMFFDGQEGGFRECEVPDVVKALDTLSHVRLVGVTAFPCLRYNETREETVDVTPNMATVRRVAEQLCGMGVNVTQINAPGNTSCHVMPLLKAQGATHVEPGNGLLGTTPSHAFRDDLPERTAFVYVTEISHFFQGRAYAYGGGVYHTNYSDHIDGLVGADWDEARHNKVPYHYDVQQDIDYHMQLLPRANQRCQPGDSALFAYRTQMHMTRSYVVPVSGVSGQRERRLHYVFDNANTALDQDFNPVDPVRVREDIDALLTSYL